MSRPDPTDWANKRKAAVERAKQLREERKRGTGMDDSEHTFTPQINQRPSYLNKTANDSLDLLASNSQKYQASSNDIFEQPLPGNRPQPSGSKERERERERDSNSRVIPSPTSDALGNEMKKFPQRDRAPSTGTMSNSSNNSFRECPSDHIDSYTNNERLGSAGSRTQPQQQQQQQPRSQQRQNAQQQQQQQVPQLSPQKSHQKAQYQQPQFQSQSQFQNQPPQLQQKCQQQQQRRSGDQNYQYQVQHDDIDGFQSQNSLSQSQNYESYRPLSAHSQSLRRPPSAHRQQIQNSDSSSKQFANTMSQHDFQQAKFSMGNILSPNKTSHQSSLSPRYLAANILSPTSNTSHQNILQGNGSSYPGNILGNVPGNATSGVLGNTYGYSTGKGNAFNEGGGNRWGVGGVSGVGTGQNKNQINFQNQNLGNIPNDVLSAFENDFQNNLRPDESSRSAGPGWNNDISVGNIELNVPILKQKRNTLSSSASTNLIESNYSQNKDRDRDGFKSDTIGRKSSGIISSNKNKPQWNDNSEIKPDDSYLNSVGDYTEFDEEVQRRDASSVTQARSRLSLLKSKMRRSESSGGVRAAEDPSALDLGSNGYISAAHAPKSAPQGRRSSSSSDGRHQAEHRESFSLGQTNGNGNGNRNGRYNSNNDNYKNGDDSSYDRNERDKGGGGGIGSGTGSGNDKGMSMSSTRRDREIKQPPSSSSSSSRSHGNYDGNNGGIRDNDYYGEFDNYDQFQNGSKNKNSGNNNTNNRNYNDDNYDYGHKNIPQKGIISRGFGAEYPDGYTPPQLDTPRGNDSTPERAKIPPRKSSLRNGNVRDDNDNDFKSTGKQNKNGFSYDDDIDDYSTAKNQKNSFSNANNENRNNNNRQNSSSSYNDSNSRNSDMGSNLYTDPGPDLYEADTSQMRQCPNCERKFNPKPYEKHIQICSKINAKRKVFDSTKMRVEGNPELIQILNKQKKEENKRKAAEIKKFGKTGGGMGGGGGGGDMRRESESFNGDYDRDRGRERERHSTEERGNEIGGDNRDRGSAVGRRSSTVDRDRDRGGGGESTMQAELIAANAAASKKSKWQAESNAFRESMRAARQVSKAIATGAPLPPPIASAPDPSLIQCPHCSRRFNAKAADRHIPVCTNIRAKPSMLKKGLGGGGGVNGTLAATKSASSTTSRKGRIM